MKTLKDILREKAPVGPEKPVPVADVNVPLIRNDSNSNYAASADLIDSIEKEGLLIPITIWSDGTLVSGYRRLRACVSLNRTTIPAVTVDTIEDAAKRLLSDNGNEHLAVPLLPSEMCRLWDVLIELDAPAAAVRRNEARRRGVELRKQTQLGQRKAGRSKNKGTAAEYLMGVLGEPFGMAEATASRLHMIHRMINDAALPADRRERAAAAMIALDEGKSSIWASYDSLIVKRPNGSTRARLAPPTEPASPAKQRASWDRILPQLEGLTDGLTQLGTPNPGLTSEQVAPVHARLMKIRRDIEKVINGMKEHIQS